MGDRVGQQFGNYRLSRLLGQGGFAEVYLAEHLHLGTPAAIKVLTTRLSEQEREHFRHEARTDKERLRDLADRASGKTQPAGDHVQPGVTPGQDAKVVLLGRPQTEAVDLLQQARPLQVGQADLPLPFRTADPSR